MKVLMTCDSVGGVWTYAVDLCKELGKRGAAVLLVTFGSKLTEDQENDLLALDNVSVHRTEYKLEWMDNPWDDVAASGRLLQELEREFDADIVHLNGYAHSSLPFRAPKVVVGHSCVASWWKAVRRESMPPRWARYEFEVSAGLRGANFVVTPTRDMLVSLHANYRFETSGGVIFNGRDRSRFRPEQKQEFVFAAGRVWDEAKNLKTLDGAAKSVVVPVYIAGERQVDANCAPDREGAHFLGRISGCDVAEWLSRAAVYALPAIYEPFGLSILEAALSGCALVIGDIPSLRELWADAAVFVPPRCEKSLVNALNELFENPSRLETLANLALERAQQYSLGQMGSEYWALYSALTWC